MNRRERKLWDRRFLALFLALLMVVGVAVPNSSSINTYAAETSQEGETGQEAESAQETAEEVASSEAETQGTAEQQNVNDGGDTGDGGGSGSSSGASMDVTSRLVIDDNDTSVQAGEPFQFVIEYNTPNLGADQGNAFSNAMINFTLPEYLQINLTEDGEYQVSGAEFSRIAYNDRTEIYTIYLNEGGSLALNTTNTVTITLVTDNLITPDETVLSLDDFTFSVTYLDTNNDPEDLDLEVPSASTTVQAESNWEIAKDVISSDPTGSVSYVRDGDYFEVTYQITVTDADGVNRLGRLGFEAYSLTDTLPTGLPEGGEAVEVKDVKILHGSTEVALEEGDDYTLIQDVYKRQPSG